MTKVLVVTDVFPKDVNLSSNGGDYYFGRSFLINDYGIVIAGRHWTSADFQYDQSCGQFQDYPEEDGVSPTDALTYSGTLSLKGAEEIEIKKPKKKTHRLQTRRISKKHKIAMTGGIQIQ